MSIVDELLEEARHYPATRNGVRRFIDHVSAIDDDTILLALERAINETLEKPCHMLTGVAAERELHIDASWLRPLGTIIRFISMLVPLLKHVESERVMHELVALAADPHQLRNRRIETLRMATEYGVTHGEQDLEALRQELSLRLLDKDNIFLAHELLIESLALLDGKERTPEYDLPWITEQPWDIMLPESDAHAAYDTPLRRPVPKVGRNEPCPCGSGQKYKRCCYEKDQERLSDPSSYAGFTREELLQNPGLTDDPDAITELRPHQLAAMEPAKFSDSQLIPAFENLIAYTYYTEAQACLEEACRRRPHRNFTFDWLELYQATLKDGRIDVAREARSHIKDDELPLPELIALLEDANTHPEHYALLDRLGRLSIDAAADAEHAQLPGIAAAGLAKLFPGLAILLARSAIGFTNAENGTYDALHTLHCARALLGANPFDDPSEELGEVWLDFLDDEEESFDSFMDHKELLDSASEAKRKQAEAQNKLNETRAELERLRRQLTQREAEQEAQAQKLQLAADIPTGSPSVDTETLKRKFQNAKAEIAQLQDQRQRLTYQLQREKQRAERHAAESPADTTHPPATAATPPEQDLLVGDEPCSFTGRILLPSYSPEFTSACEELPPAIVGRALHAVSGFATGSQAIWQHVQKLTVPPHHYRVRIGIHYRLILHWLPGETLRAVALLPREEFDAWIRRH